MPDFDLDILSLVELKQLNRAIVKAIDGFGERKKAEAMVALEAHAKELGFTLAELFGTAPIRKRAEATPKYRHPENPSITWSGRGRKPLWFQAALDAGKSPDDLVI